MASQNELARRLRALHVPGNPVVFANVYDGATAQIVASLPHAKAIATASYAIAGTYGLEDNDMTLEQNLAGIEKVAAVTQKAQLPLTADLQDGYKDVAITIQRVIKLGVVGCNLEDVDKTAGNLRSLDEAVERIKTALRAATDAGVPDFVVNARTDVLGFGGSVQDAVTRAQAYLDAGAANAFVWGGPKGRGLSADEVRTLVKELKGRVNVLMRPQAGYLNVQDLKEIGVARISVGPAAYRAAMAGFKETAEKILGQ
jgi:2-methylisocitrate lyase-like PEP mutase family enzyme